MKNYAMKNFPVKTDGESKRDLREPACKVQSDTQILDQPCSYFENKTNVNIFELNENISAKH